VSYDRSLQLLTIQVTNFPGVGHDRLCLLSAAEAAKFFDKDSQIKATQQGADDAATTRNESSSNGAWIMKKVNIISFWFPLSCRL
jgi:hypothetical protein